jgi:Ca2+-binding EF-hand superfamily protein
MVRNGDSSSEDEAGKPSAYRRRQMAANERNCQSAGSIGLSKTGDSMQKADATKSSPLRNCSSAGNVGLSGLDRLGTPGLSPQTTSKNSRLREASLKQIEEMKERRRQERQFDCGISTLEDLKRQLVINFGSVYGGWRVALDLDGNNRLSHSEFCIAMRNLGYGGNVKDIWHSLDQDSDGFIQLSDIDKQCDEEISTYQKLVQEKHPNLLKAWTSEFDKSGAGHVELESFAKHCKQIGWQGNVQSLFTNLKGDRTRKFLTLRDYDVRAWNAHNRGDLEMVSEEKTPLGQLLKMGFWERQQSCFSQRWARMNAEWDRRDMKKLSLEEQRSDKAASSIDSMRTMLLRKYGTMTSAWKHGIDVYGNNRVPFGEFCIALRKLGFHGDLKAAFRGLDKERKGAVTLRDFDQGAHQVVSEFRTLLLQKYDSYIKGWKAMDANGNGVIEEHEIEEACVNVGYSGNPHILFRHLLDGPGKRSITMADIDPAAYQAFVRGDLEAMSPQDKAKAQLKARKALEDAEKAKRMDAADWPSLKKVLIRKHGTITSAWRDCLDHNSNGSCSFFAFTKAVRDLGFSGNIKKVFKELDDDDSGLITFNEVDPDWYSKLSRLHEVLMEKYKSYENAWRALDDNGNGTADEDEFAAFMEKAGYEHDAKKLFRQLLKNQQVFHLTLEDLEAHEPIIRANKLDPNASMKIMRLNTDNLSRQDKAKYDLEQRKAKELAEKEAQFGAHDWTRFKNLLIHKYGTITAAWRHGLETHGKGKLSFTAFSTACHNHGYEGNLKECFAEVDYDESGVITFDEIDEEWFRRHALFCDLYKQKYGSFEKAWEAMDKSHKRRVELEDFQHFCEGIGFTDNPKGLFKQLLPDLNQHALTADDVGFTAGFVDQAKSAMEHRSSPEGINKSYSMRSLHKAKSSANLSTPKSSSSPGKKARQICQAEEI